MERLHQERDLEGCDVTYFSTSQAGQTVHINGEAQQLQDAYAINQLAVADVLLVAQGSEYTKTVHGPLRATGWSGYWIDAASQLRMAPNSIIVLDPINQEAISTGLKQGIKDFIGSNCTVSLMLMALAGLVKRGVIKAIQATTYQAISGSGAKAISELQQQMTVTSTLGAGRESLALANHLHAHLQQPDTLPTTHIKAPLAANLLPWIDQPADHGQSREEWKGMVETNKIVNAAQPILVDSTCVRVPALRCHSQSLFIELTETLALDEIETHIATAHPWIELIPNTQAATLEQLTPITNANTLTIRLGRLRKTHRGERFIQCFTVGDQLLWGAAEPLRRMLNIIKVFHKERLAPSIKAQTATDH